MLLKNPARHPSFGVFSFLLLASLGHVQAQVLPAEPFSSRDQNPLVSIYGLPLPANARLPAAGDSYSRTTLNVTNTLNLAESGSSQLHVDTETTQFTWLYAYTFAPDWTLRLQAGIISHRAGFLDNWIDNYHQLLGLKEGMRPLIEQDQFRIYVSDNGNTLIYLQTSQSGFGDFQIQIGTQLSKAEDSAASIWASLKLPTGNSAKLTGSGAIDFALWLSTQQQLSANTWLYADIGGLTMGSSDVLTPIHRSTAAFGNLGLVYNFNHWLQLKTQFDCHSAMYNTQLDFIDTALQLTFGGSITLDTSNTMDIAVSEDILSLSSPDVTFNLSWLTRF